MCGRLVHTLTPNDYAAYVDLALPAMVPNLDVRPTECLPIVHLHENQTVFSWARWGFPSYRGSKVLFNARSETAHQLPSFREAYRKGRGLLFTSGWYEWKDRKRHWIHRKDSKPVVMAILWQQQQFTLLTRAANQLAWLHPREPVILLKRDWLDWLNGNLDLKTLEPFPTGPLIAEITPNF